MRPIGIFDSGVGGLGILSLIAKKLPHYDLVYVADNANLPFGQKSVDQLNQITEKIVRFLVKQHQVQLVVIACNTATVTSINYLRQRFTVPIVGAVPVVKPTCEQTKTTRVAIMATPTTINSEYLKNLIAQYANGANVLPISCPGLAELVDAGDLQSPQLLEALKRYLEPALAHNVDVIGLGCTQYPFLREIIKKLIPPHVIILDSNEPVANQVERVLSSQSNEGSSCQHSPTYTFYATKDAQVFCSVAQQLVGPIVKKVSELELDNF